MFVALMINIKFITNDEVRTFKKLPRADALLAKNLATKNYRSRAAVCLKDYRKYIS